MTTTLDAAPPGQSRRVAVGVIVTVLLSVVTFAVGKGVAAMTTRAHPGNVWLRTVPRGTLTLVDGVTGRVSAGLTLPGAAGHELQISQQGAAILVYDPATGVLTRINTGTLTAGASRATVPGVALVAGATAAYLVDYGAATAQRIDLNTLSGSGPIIRLGGQIGQAGVDAAGTLWLPRADTGQAIPVTGGQVGVPVAVAPARSDLSVSIVGGKPVVVDGTHGKVSLVSGTGVAWTGSLPQGGVQWVVPPTQAGGLLPLVGTAQHVLDLIDLDHRQVQAVPLGPGSSDQLGAPVANGGRVYIPDYSTGRVLNYNAAGGAWDPSFPVTGKPEPFDAVAKDGVVYFNNPDGPQTIVVGGDGKPTPLDKYTTPKQRSSGPNPPVPGATAPALPPALPPVGNPVGPQRHGPGTLGSSPPLPPAPTPAPSTPASPPAGPPLAPVNVQVTALAAAVDVTWTVLQAGGPVTGFTVTSQQGVQQTVDKAARTARFTGLDCATAYQFTVTALGGAGQQAPSSPSAAVHPCTAPTAPTGVSASGGQDGSIQVRWAAQTGASFEIAYAGPTSGRLRSTNNSITIPAGSLTYLGRYTVTVYAANAVGTSSGSGASATAGPAGTGFRVDVSLTRTDPKNPCLNLAVCRAQINTGPSHTSGVVGYAPQGSTVTGYCHKPGQLISNDLGQNSTEWIYTTGFGTGYIPSLWLGGPNAYRNVPPCP